MKKNLFLALLLLAGCNKELTAVDSVSEDTSVERKVKIDYAIYNKERNYYNVLVTFKGIGAGDYEYIYFKQNGSTIYKNVFQRGSGNFFVKAFTGESGSVGTIVIAAANNGFYVQDTLNVP